MSPRLPAFPLALALPLAALIGAGCAAAQGTPRSIGECERLKNDLAYNQCLAMFGPAAKNVAGGYASADAMPALAAPAMAATLPQAEEAEEPAPSARRGRSYRWRHGRQSAVFTAGGEVRSYRRRRHRS